MRLDDAKAKIALTATRIAIFLENNQLVQAHGLAQTLSKSMEEIIDFESKQQRIGVEKHVWYQAFKSVIRMQSLILAGKSIDALNELKGSLYQEGKK